MKTRSVLLAAFFMVLGAVAMLSSNVMAFEYKSYVEGKKTIATDNAVVVGGKVFPVKDNPATVAEIEAKLWWLGAMLDDAYRAEAAKPKSECDK